MRDASVTDTDTTVAGFNQPMRVAGLAYGGVDALQWGRGEQGVDFFDVRGDVEALLAPLQPRFEAAEHPAMHPGRCARVLLGMQAIGFVGELHPRWRQAYDLARPPMLFELALDAVLSRTVPAFQPVAKHQAVARDIAVVVGEQVAHDQLIAAVRAAPTGGLLRDAVLFDIYRPKPAKGAEGQAPSGGLAPGEKSLAVRLTLNDNDATLTDEQIDTAVQAIVQQLATSLGARLRA
jgi:phenylalanyl-tRNA synthetase beta chain